MVSSQSTSGSPIGSFLLSRLGSAREVEKIGIKKGCRRKGGYGTTNEKEVSLPKDLHLALISGREELGGDHL